LNAQRAKAEGALAPFGAFVLVLGLMAAPAQGVETTNPRTSNLPAPGTYALQRIQRIPDAQLLDAEDKPMALSVATRGQLRRSPFSMGIASTLRVARSRGRHSKPCNARRRMIRFCAVD